MVGYSAIDLLNYVVNTTAANGKLLAPKPFFSRSEFYWAGWALAQYQNYKTTSFFNISKAFPIEKVLSLYNTLHEAYITKFFSVADEYIDSHKKETNLKRIRTARAYRKDSLLRKRKFLFEIYKCTNNVLMI